MLIGGISQEFSFGGDKRVGSVTSRWGPPRIKAPINPKIAENLIECRKFHTVHKKIQLGNLGGGHVPLAPFLYAPGADVYV